MASRSFTRTQEIQRQEQPGAIAGPQQLNVVRRATQGRAARHIAEGLFEMSCQAAGGSIRLEAPQDRFGNRGARDPMCQQHSQGKRPPQP